LSGFLVGGASTDAEKFLKIVEEVVGIQWLFLQNMTNQDKTR
jgi:hypothetical protein